MWINAALRLGGKMEYPINSAATSKINWAASLSTLFVALMNIAALQGYLEPKLALELTSIGVVLINVLIQVFRTYFTKKLK
jgi:hypothetical protein